MPEPRKICVVTGTRAEYGLLSSLMGEVKGDPNLELQVIVTGAHLEKKFGETYRAIEEDGFTISHKIPCHLHDDSPRTITAAMATIVTGMSEALDQLKPDVVVILGDRYEVFAVAQACLIHRVAIAHIHGGEATEGLIDEAIRHAISKMAHLHFTSAEPYRQRLIQMGETPERVFTCGAPGLDQIENLQEISKQDLFSDFGLAAVDDDFLLVTYHPLTLDQDSSMAGAHGLIKALDSFPAHKVILTGVNADPGSSAIDDLLSTYAASQPERVIARTSLGQRRYLSAMTHAAAVIGNSSSGLIEAPAIGVPSVNIGERQRGRLCAPSVVSCGNAPQQIEKAIEKALSAQMQEIAARKETPYGAGGASHKIKEILKSSDLDGILFKRFHNLDVPS